jgi:hypothetical protein
VSCQLNFKATLKVGSWQEKLARSSWQEAVGKNQNSNHNKIKTI